MSYKKRSYQRGGPGKRPPFAVFDLETDGLGGKVLAASWMMEGEDAPSFIKGGDVIQKLFYIMCENHNFHWFAHNSQYDLRYFVDRLKQDMSALKIYLRTDNDIFMVSLDLPDHGDGARLVLRDSYAVFPAKLASFASAMCPELPKLELDFDTETFNPNDARHVEYAKRDAEALLRSLIRFDALVFATFDVHIRATTASTALAAWERSLAKGEYYQPPRSHDDLIRSAYYGGLVFLTDTNATRNARTFDLNSSYPYQMMIHEFPVGIPAKTMELEHDRFGIYHVTVKAPDGLRIPILPKRDRKGIVWPSGIFDTVVTNVDLQMALVHGYRLLLIHEGLVWPKSASPFRDFVTKCRQIRKNHKGTALEIVAKLMQNSLYGKFGSKKIRRKLYATIEDDELLGYEPWGDFYIREELDADMLALPQWSAFVTAYARRHLLDLAYKAGVTNVLYGDTDSLTLRSGIDLPVGNEYGDLKLEKEWQTFRIRAPKVYGGLLVSGKVAGAIKGIPRKEWHKSNALHLVIAGQNGQIRYTTLPSLMAFLKGDERAAYSATRQISDIERSRTWKIMPDGTTRPRSYEEILARSQRRATPELPRLGLEPHQAAGN